MQLHLPAQDLGDLVLIVQLARSHQMLLVLVEALGAIGQDRIAALFGVAHELCVNGEANKCYGMVCAAN